MLRFGFLAVLGALCGVALPAHAQVPYQPPTIGQTYLYKDWQCAVTAVDGMATRCRLADGREFVLYAGIEPVGEGAPRPLDALRRLSCGGNAATIESYSLDDEARAALAGLWPLAVGNTAQYRIGLVLAFGAAGRNSPQIPVRTEVAGRETVTVGAGAYDAFVIRQEVKGACRRANTRWAYVRTLHYAPALHAVVREEVRWTAGDDMECPHRVVQFDC